MNVTSSRKNPSHAQHGWRDLLKFKETGSTEVESCQGHLSTSEEVRKSFTLSVHGRRQRGTSTSSEEADHVLKK